MVSSEMSIVVAHEAREPEERLISLTRIVLTLSGQLLLVVLHESHRYYVAAVLVLYSLYALWLHIALRRHGRYTLRFNAYAHWVDVAWCIVFVAIMGNTGNVFSFACLFPIFVASFRDGFAAGLLTTIVSVVSLGAVNYIRFSAFGPTFDPYRFIPQTAWLFGLGYMMAHWGQAEITLKRRLELLKEVTSSSNPRFGIDRTVGSILERLKEFYGARSCLLVMKQAEGFRLRSTNERDPEASAKSDRIPPEFGLRLLDMPPEYAAVHNATSEGWWHLGWSCQLLDIELGRVTRGKNERCENLAAILDAKSFVTVPVSYRNETVARLYLESDKCVFRSSDMQFLLELIDHVNPIIENIELVEQLAGHAAEEERSRIARDIHDSVIQPYIGLQMGLTAMRKKTGENYPELATQIEHLMTLAQYGIDDLRRYVAGLKDDGGPEGGLLPAMRRFTTKFSVATGLAVRLEVEGDIHANNRLAAETFHMMAEGLSNIRKHTRATGATVRLACYNGSLRLEIADDDARTKSAALFTPASITERAAALGGRVHVRSLPGGGSSVAIDIPL